MGSTNKILTIKESITTHPSIIFINPNQQPQKKGTKTTNYRRLFYFSNGNIQNESLWRNQIMDGKSRTFYETGKLRAEENWVEGKRYGIQQYFNQGESLVEEQKWNAETEIIQTNTFFKDGKTRTITQFKNGKPVYIYKYYCNGQQKCQGRLQSKKFILASMYYHNGKPAGDIDMLKHTISVFSINGELLWDKRTLKHPDLYEILRRICMQGNVETQTLIVQKQLLKDHLSMSYSVIRGEMYYD